MRRRLILILISLYLLGSTELHQVLKLPILIEHYIEHRGQVKMSFMEFLAMHYETDVPHDDNDMRLPFKDCQHPSTAQHIVMPGQNMFFGVPVASSTNLTSFYDSRLPFSYFDDIFRPPKG